MTTLHDRFTINKQINGRKHRTENQTNNSHQKVTTALQYTDLGQAHKACGKFNMLWAIFINFQLLEKCFFFLEKDMNNYHMYEIKCWPTND